MAGPLSGLKVIDFSRVLAGPLCARTLLDLGASVTKIEPPRPDVTRFSPPSNGEISGYFAQQNAGKRNLSIDLNQPGATDLVKRLCKDADIIVENFRAHSLSFFGLGYHDISAINPTVIYASITGYGQTGPWQGRMAYAPTVQAEAGFTANTNAHFESLNSWQTDALSHADVYAGLQATIAILAALNDRAGTGKGQYIDVSMAATLMAVNERAHLDLTGVDLGDEPGILGATDCPFFEDADGQRFTLATSLVSSLTFRQYLAAMRRPDLGDDPRFKTAKLRRKNYQELHQLIQEWIYSFSDTAALEAQLDESKIAMGRVRTLDDAKTSDWREHWGDMQTVPDRQGGEYLLPVRPWKFSNNELPTLGAPALQGEHNSEVMKEIGLSKGIIDELHAKRVLVVSRSLHKNRKSTASNNAGVDNG